jgi:DUF3071 family protein
LATGEVKSVLTLEEAAMRALRVVGLGEDGKIVICETDRGERFQIPADERLRAAARGDITRLGQIAIELESQMRPREIQTRIRAGESVEQVAAAAGVPPERVERFAYPVLLERSRTAELAQKAHPVREDGPDVQELGEVVAQAFTARSQDYTAAVWDSWKGEDGKWVVQLTWTAGRSNNHAHWSFHPGAHGGTVTPLDDHALDLLDPNPNRQLRTVRPVTELAAQALQVSEQMNRRQAVNGGEPPRRVEEQDYVQDFELTDDAPGQQQPPAGDQDPYGRPAATTRPREDYRPPRDDPRRTSDEEYRDNYRPAAPAREETRGPASARDDHRPAPVEDRPRDERQDTPAATHTAPPTEQAIRPSPTPRTPSPAPRPSVPSVPSTPAVPPTPPLAEEPTPQQAASPQEPAAATTSPATTPAQEEEPTAPRPAARPTMPTIDDAAAPAAEEPPAAAQAAEPTPPAAPPARKGKGRKARPSVPSWEDVLLGTRSNR